MRGRECGDRGGRATGRAAAVLLRLALRSFPADFRRRFGEDLESTFDARRALALRRGGPRRELTFVARNLVDITLAGLGARLDGLAAERRESRSLDRELRLGLARRARHTRGVTMADLRLDLRCALRSLLVRNLGLTAVCVLTLGLGIGVTTATFSVVNGVLLEPLPYGEPDRIVRLYRGSERNDGFGFLAGPNFVDYRERLDSFEVLAAMYDYRPEGLDLLVDGQARRLSILRVSSGFFEALGVPPLLGRGFSRDEEIPPGAGERDPEIAQMITAPSAPVVVLSHDFWRRELSSDRDVLGATLRLDGESYEVIGVMPAELGGLVGGDVDLWLPLDLAPGGVNVRYNNYLSAVGRLRPGVTLEQAQREIDGVAAQLEEAYPGPNEDLAAALVPLRDVVLGDSSRMLLLLLLSVALVLLVACVNVANLFLARAVARQRELLVRSALGAGRLQLLRLSAIESLVVASLGGLLGVVLSAAGVRALLALRPAALPRYDAIGLDPAVLAFAAVVTLLTALVFGTFPAFRSSRSTRGSSAAHGDDGTGVRGAGGRGGPRVRRLQGALAAAQIAMAVVLLAAGGLLVRSFVALNAVDLGFEPEGVVTYRLRLPDHRYGDPATRRAFYRALHERVEALPGVRSSGATSKLPADGHRNHWGFGIEGRERREGAPSQGAEIRCVDGDLFAALSIDVLRGRPLAPTDRVDAERVVLVNHSLASLHWPDGDPVGSRLMVGSGEARTVVGVVADTRHDHREEAVPKIYVPHEQFADDRNWDLSFVVSLERGTAPLGVVEAITSAVASLDRQLAIYDVNSMAQVAERSIARQRFAAQLMVVFAALTLLLAAVGIYGVLAYAVSQRRSEIGVRMAIGAGRGEVLGLVLRQGLAITATGVGLGLFGTVLSARLLRSLLWEVSSTDPVVLGLTVALLVAVGLVAVVVPARRALRVDPAQTLRQE